MSRKKVLFVITKSNWGGAQRYVYDLATHLDRQTFEIVVAAGGDGILMEMLAHAGIRTIPLTTLSNSLSPKALLASSRELYSLFRHEKPAVLHTNSSVAGFVGNLVGQLARVPRIIFTAHGWAFNEDRPLLTRLGFKLIHYCTVLLSDYTIAVSRAIITQLAWPGTARKMKLIHPGRTIGPMFERTEAGEKIVDFFPRLTPYQNDPWITCIAELHPIKRHTVLFEAVRTLIPTHPTLRLLCLGDGTLRDSLTAAVAEGDLSEHIFILGNLHEAARFLPAFDIATLVSRSESYGYVLHEAGIAGVPVVATNVGGIPDIITNHVTGLLVPPEDSIALAAALHTLLATPSPAAQYTTRLSTQLSKRTAAAMATATTALYTAR